MTTIDLSRDALFDDLGLKRLRESYMRPDETSPQHRFAYVADAFGSNPNHAQRLYDYVSQHWLSLSTPMLAYGRTRTGLPISCYLSFLPDTSRGLLDTLSEVNELSMLGGGVSVGVGIRSPDDKSTGVLMHLSTYDASVLAFKQGNVRRGSTAAYLDIDHPEIQQFIDMRKTTGDHRIRCHNLNHGVNISDDFMRIVKQCTEEKDVDDSWALVDPHTKSVVKTVSVKDLWQHLLETRMRVGEPYLHFIDTSNRLLPKCQRDKGLKVRQSNLCCVSYDTLLLTDQGHVQIGELQGRRVNVWNGDTWSRVTVVKTGIDQKMVRVTLSDGKELICTPNHKFILHGCRSIRDSERVCAANLTVGSKLFRWPPAAPDVSVISVAAHPDRMNTFCFMEPLNHAGVFNGILTGQSEIIEVTDENRTAICALASLNLERYDEWKNHPTFVADAVEMLDNAVGIFIDRAPPGIHRAKHSAMMERSIGLGFMGWHALLQKHSIAFESNEARLLNVAICSDVSGQVSTATLKLGSDRGEPSDAVGTGRRNVLTMAIAPTASSSIILGNTSPSIEPFRANAYRQDTISGSFMNKNKYLDALLKQRCANNADYEAAWHSVVMNSGSVRHLTMLSDHEKAVFKTAFEIDQMTLINLAADRQPFIDQAQSLNLFLRPDTSVKELHALHFAAWERGLKTLYYLRSTKLVETDKLGDTASVATKVCSRRTNPGECTACQ